MLSGVMIFRPQRYRSAADSSAGVCWQFRVLSVLRIRGWVAMDPMETSSTYFLFFCARKPGCVSPSLAQDHASTTTWQTSICRNQHPHEQQIEDIHLQWTAQRVERMTRATTNQSIKEGATEEREKCGRNWVLMVVVGGNGRWEALFLCWWSWYG